MRTLTCLAASRQSFFLLAVILLFAACCFSQEKILPQEEIDVLKEINSKLKVGWNFSANPCSEERTWRWNISNEITRYLVCDNCNGTICHVRQILLKGQNLTGDVPEDFGNLTYLFEIDLSRNYLSGSIPTTAWASLPLRIITLGGNRLAGLIPDDIGKITTLETINLENNLLNGSLPATLGKLTNLTRLLLAANNFTGELPKELVNLKNLQDFRIDGNGISGKIPNFIGNLTNLKRFDMQGTSMEGPFPSTFHTLDNLEQLTVSDFKGIGDFPALPTTNMKILVLRNCSLSGPLPDYIGEMRKIRRLDLSFNNLTGGIPETYNSLSSLENLYLTNNRLNGSIPNWILRSGKFMDISFNTFTGLPAPDIYLGSQLNLVASYSPLESDSINTYLKRDLPCAEKAKNYNFFINCGGSSVNFGGVEYESDVLPGGTSTFFVSDSKKWAYSSTGEFLGDNNLPNILKISASNFANSELYSSARMCASSLRYFGLCLKKGSYTVNLSFAEIIFTNGANFSSLGRRLFDVSVQGKKVLKDFNIAEEANGAGRGITKSFIVDVEGSTLEIHLQWAGKGTNAIPIRGVYGPLISAISVTPNFKPDPMPFGAILGIIASSLILSVLIITFFWFYLRKNHRQNTELQGLDLPTGNFSLKQIKSGTRNFNPANKIGEGGFGPVYKCVLPDGGVVAVKQLSSKSRQGNREFVNEIGMISGLNHPNLVKLHGCCMEGNQLLLIYEYMEKNSLARALFGPEGMRLTLDWRTRYKICLGVANGLAYLHEESRLKIVHRDIKATNILLDKDLNAKISDFGLAKLDEEDNSHISTRIAGTVEAYLSYYTKKVFDWVSTKECQRGYMAPEYAMKGYLTNKADVYSFGVVVLEVISGKSNGSFRPCEEFEYLLDWAHALKEENLLQVVDPILRGNYSKEEARLLLDLALQCTNQSADLRPIMSAVVRLLGGDPSMSRVNDMEEVALSSFEQLSHDYQGDASSYGPSMNSSVSATSSKDCSYHYSSGALGISSYGPTSSSIPANDGKGNGTSVSQEARLLPTTE